MQRYYGQQYARLDDTSTPASNIGLEPYTPYDAHRQLPTQQEPYTPYDAERQLPTQQEPDTAYSAPRQLPTQQPPPNYSGHNPLKTPKAAWSRRRKLIIFGSIAALVVVIAIVVGVAVALSNSKYSYTPSYAQVTNSDAFTSGGATHNNPNDTSDGIGAGEDKYVYYQGPAANFPASTSWVSFDDMWKANLVLLQTSCSTLGEGSDNSPEVIQDIYNAIQQISNASLVDHRFIFAVILQESQGCVHVKATVSSGGVKNPGIMQSHNGYSYSSAHSALSILAMVQSGTQGTADGAGLVQNLNTYGDPYSAARGYNSGYIPKDGNLSAAAGATACYVTDIANRLTGWTRAKSTCPGDAD